MEQIKSVFLSYAPQDGELAQKLIDALQAAGVGTVSSAQTLDSGMEWQQHIEQSIKAADAVVVLVGSKDEPARAQQFEWRVALEEKWEKPSKRLIPLLLRNAPLPSFLSSRQALRVRDPKREWGKAVEQLLRILKDEQPESEGMLSTEQEALAKRRARLQYIEEAAENLRMR